MLSPQPGGTSTSRPRNRDHPGSTIVAPEDQMVQANYAVARQAYDPIPGPKQWYDIVGGHFGLLYWPSELFDDASRVQTEYLKKWL